MSSWWRRSTPEMKKLARLTGPILIAQLTQTLMSVVDTVMAGQKGAIDLAAVSVGSSIWIPVTLLVFGLAMGLAPVVSNLHGAKKYHQLANMLQQGFYTCVLGGVVSLAGLMLSPWLLDVMQVEPEFRQVTLAYIGYVAWGVPGFVLYVVLRNFCEGLSHTMPSLVIGFVGLLINIPANYAFIYGHWGMPALGGAGCGLATALVFWGMALSLLGYVVVARRFQSLQLFATFYWPSWDDVVYLIRIGFPIAMSLFFEVSLFAAAALVIAPLGPTVVSSHQIALNISSLVYMVPLSLSMAVTLRVGFALGAGNPDNAKVSHQVALLFGMTFATVNGLAMWLLGSWLAGFYTDDMAIIHLAAQLMGLAAIFTISDTFQAISMGTLRGYKDTKAAMLITFVSYWPFGLVVGIILARSDWLVSALGAAGMWIGFIAGLSCAAVLLSWRLKRVIRDYQTAAFRHQLNEEG
ncbi:MATE family efflux transporter [Idiomarina tyrosinivorans]|nr:MATE family efflux transporter [Idiomarina tyrosinivorans]